MHPGGAAVMLDPEIAGKDSTEAFFGLHRASVLSKYKKLRIGRIEGEKPKLIYPTIGVNSTVPFAEPGYLAKGFKSPYYKVAKKYFVLDCHSALD